MITRTLSRAKVVQILFAHYKNEGKTSLMLEKELLFSFQKTYDLYCLLLQLALDVTEFASQKIEYGKNKLLPSYEEQNPNMRFVENSFVEQLAQNIQLDEYVSQNKLSWANYEEVVKSVYTDMLATDFYQAYMEDAATDYQNDKLVWRKIYDKVVLNNKMLYDALEEMSIYWLSDVDVIESFVVKTIKRFELENGADQSLLPMFNSEEDLQFSKKLLTQAVKKSAEYQELIDTHTKNWDYDRLAYMDTIIMQVAMAEIMSFPTIPVNVTLNEYIEIAKGYSTSSSAQFINGVLDEIVGLLKKENKLIKAVVLSDK